MRRKPSSQSIDDEKPLKLRPGRPRGRDSSDPIRFTAAVTRLLRVARQSSRIAQKSGNGHSRSSRAKGGRTKVRGTSPFTKTYQQRGTATVRYMNRGKNGKTGGFKRHGKYLERDGTGGKDGPRPGDRVGIANDQDLSKVADSWEKAGDPRMWKIVISPENSENVDFKALAESVVEEMEKETGTKFEWGGIVHRNTDHPHMHLIIRGVREDGQPLLLTRKQVQQDVRKYVQKELTRQLGPRTAAEVAEQRLRETQLDRPTGLDRDLSRKLPAEGERGRVEPGSQLEKKRLEHLETLGLAKRDGNAWTVDRNFTQQLKNMQNVRERGRALFRDGVALSDHTLPIEISNRSRRLAGRVLLNSEEEGTGQMQTAIETLDGKVVFLRHDAALRNAWNRGDLKPGNVVLIDQLKSEPGRFYVAKLGEDSDLLKDKGSLRTVIERLRKADLLPGDAPTEKGWLGKFFKEKELDRSRTRGMSL
jgi:hypothetical protein